LLGSMSDLWRWIPPLLYGWAAVTYGAKFPVNRMPGRASRLSGPIAVGGHFLQLLALSLVQSRFPFGTMWEALSVSTLVFAGSYLLLERLARTTALGFPFFFLSVVGTGLAAAHNEPARWPVMVQSTLFAAHVSLGVVGIGLLAASGLLAANWLVLYRLLRGRRFGAFAQTMPDLATLDRLFLAASSLGTVLLACGAVLGLEWMRSYHIALSAVYLKSSTVFLVVAWNTVIPVLRRRQGWSSSWAAWMGFLGLVPLALVVWAGTRAL